MDTARSYVLEAAVLSDIGCRRDANEDCGRVVQPADPEVSARKGVLVMVADGMGGHRAGEIASLLAVDLITRVYYDHPGNPTEALTDAFHQANQKVFQLAEGQPDYRGMGSTCTALVIENGAAHVAHVGDSRLYLVRGAESLRLTEDHSAVVQMVKQGLLTQAQARNHADRNVILQALGGKPSVSVASLDKPLPIEAGDRYLLCTDGLHDLAQDEELLSAVSQGKSPSEVSGSLVALARQRGGFDNITVATVFVEA